MNESVKKWLEEKRAELAGRRDVAIFIEAKDVLDAIEQLSKPRLFSDSFGRESALAVFRMRNPKAIFEESAHRTIQICRAECELPGAAKYGLSS